MDVPHERERGRGVVVVAHRFFEFQERVVNRSVFTRGLCDGVEARAGVPEGLFACLCDPALCIAGFHRLLRVGRRERVRLPPGVYDGFAGSAREVPGREVQKREEHDEEGEGGAEGSHGMRLLGAIGDK